MKYRRLCGWFAALLAAVTVFSPLCATSVAAAESPSVVSVTTTESTALTTATALTAEALPLGDISGDGNINMLDALMLYGYTSGASLLSVAQQRRADIYTDGMIDTRDAITLYRLAAGALAPTTTATTPATTIATTVKGIDVSYAQGAISWQAVKASDVSFAILRCGYGERDPEQRDGRWDENAAACEELGIPYGAYFFCYARNAEEAAEEAAHALELLEGKNLSLPVFLDMEYSNWQGNISPETCAEIATVFCETVGAAGYKVGVYSNLDWWLNRLTAPCFDKWYRWVAQYNDTCDYLGTMHFWQYADDGKVDGIDGGVDMNYAYLDLSVF